MKKPSKTYILYRRIRLFILMIYTRNWYEGLDKPTLWQRFYKWRISPSTAWKVACIVWEL